MFDYLVKNKLTVLLVTIFVLSFLVRFLGLGYSSFYGDETKVFYLDKTVPAFEFFMDQRKGPIQFLVVWLVEKFVGSPHELYTRIPFALAGFFSIGVFYLLSKKLFEKLGDIKKIQLISLLATLLFSFNGFNVAFSRTVQYQSFLTLFGLFGLYLFLNKKYLYSAVAFGLAFLSHYDAIFFVTPLLYLVVANKEFSKDYKKMAVSFVLPLLLIIGSFYIPYIAKGYFETNTLNYLSKRIGGDVQTAKNFSAFTVALYNPCFITFIFLLLPLMFFVKRSEKPSDKDVTDVIKMLSLWFMVTFLSYQFFMTNPGTHIHNYLIPLYFLSGFCVVYVYDYFGTKKFKLIYKYVAILMSILVVARMFFIYVPGLNAGYPWKYSVFNNVYSKYQLFVYGFPYNRDWKAIREYFVNLDERVEGVFTNDDDDVAMYYLREFNYTKPGTNFFPQYFIDVRYNMEFTTYKPFRFSSDKDLPKEEFYAHYDVEEIISENVVIYKRIEPNNARSLGSLLYP